MGGRIFETFIGLLTAVIGFILGYFCISNPYSATPLRIFLSVVMMGVGIIILIRVGRREEKPTFKNSVKKEKSLLEKNTERITEYSKTATLRDKLRVLKHL